MSETIDDLAGARGSSVDDPSGALRAQEAHAAGAVVEPIVQPVYSVMLDVRVQGPEREAVELGDALAATLLDHPLVVQPVTLSIVHRMSGSDG